MILRLSKSKLFKNSFIYGISNAIYTGLPLILLPFLVSILSPTDYGLIELFRSLTLVLIPVVGFSTLSSVDRFFFEIDKDEYRSLISSLIIFHLLNGFGLFIILLIVSPLISPQYYEIGYLALIYCIFNQIYEIFLLVLRVNQKAKVFLILRFIGLLIDLGLLFCFYYILTKHDWSYRVYPSVISTIIMGALTIFIFFKNGQLKDLKINTNLLRASIIFSAPLILHMIAGYILNLGNRFFILHYHNENELGNFSIAFQIGMAISFFYTSFNMAWTPTYYDWMKKNEFNKIRKVRFIIYGMLLFGGLIIFLGWIILPYLIPNLKYYNISSVTILILIISFVILSLYKFEGNYYFYHKLTSKLSLFTIISCSLSLLLNFILIPKYSTLGAAISTLISYLCLYFLVIFNKNNKRYV